MYRHFVRGPDGTICEVFTEADGTSPENHHRSICSWNPQHIDYWLHDVAPFQLDAFRFSNSSYAPPSRSVISRGTMLQAPVGTILEDLSGVVMSRVFDTDPERHEPRSSLRPERSESCHQETEREDPVFPPSSTNEPIRRRRTRFVQDDE